MYTCFVSGNVRRESLLLTIRATYFYSKCHSKRRNKQYYQPETEEKYFEIKLTIYVKKVVPQSVIIFPNLY